MLYNSDTHFQHIKDKILKADAFHTSPTGSFFKLTIDITHFLLSKNEYAQINPDDYIQVGGKSLTEWFKISTLDDNYKMYILSRSSAVKNNRHLLDEFAAESENLYRRVANHYFITEL